jgi:phthiocerol/phenolphthiocerol synthesis type-I polyketide synthase E
MTDSGKVAIIGMSCRFPDARTPEEFWQNLLAGRESIRRFSLSEVAASGVPLQLTQSRDYVCARSVIDDIDMFDAEYFQLSAAEAALMDPQQRLMLECAVEALERAGVNPDAPDNTVGVFVGARTNTYLFSQTSPEQLLAAVNDFQSIIVNDKDFLATRLAYALNLRGPCINVATACSTSLVAVHLACQSLFGGECDIALAGGAAIAVPQIAGYVHRPGGIYSSDGRCRPFDASAQGTVPGNGAGLVVLKRLKDAVAAGDQIDCVIIGTAINNDGSSKVGFTAPSVDGQVAVISEALAIAGVAPSEIGYVECHGTATSLGDAVEIAALQQVFDSDKAARCAIGSLKSNFGHLDAAAGIAGLIKTALMLKHRSWVPSLHFQTPNPQLHLSQSPFFVCGETAEWRCDSASLRAGVSSFGIGGTNAHVVIEEPPSTPRPIDASSPQLLLLSARSIDALAQLRTELAAFLGHRTEANLAQLAWVLQTGRRRLEKRTFLVANSADQLRAMLIDTDRFQIESPSHDSTGIPLILTFRGAPRLQSLENFLDAFPAFAPTWESLMREAGRSTAAREAKPGSCRGSADARSIVLGQVFFARAWRQLGLEPDGVSGIGIGWLAAAVTAGMISLEDALQVADAAPVDGAASGAWLQQGEVRSRLASLRLREPELSWYSLANERWIALQEAVHPQFWLEQPEQHRIVEHGRAGLGAAPSTARLLVELDCAEQDCVGARAEREADAPPVDRIAGFLRQAGKLWCSGRELDWAVLHSPRPRRICLPTYPFQRRSHWLRRETDHAAPLPITILEAPPRDLQPRPSLDVPYVAPSNETEVLLTQIWSEVLGFDRIGIDDDYFELGGHSLLATQIFARLNEAFETNLSPQAIFDAPSVRALAAYLADIISKEIAELSDAEIHQRLGRLDQSGDLK